MQGWETVPANFLPYFVHTGRKRIFGLCKAKMQRGFPPDFGKESGNRRKEGTVALDFPVDKPVDDVNNFLYAAGFPQLWETVFGTDPFKTEKECKYL